MTTNTKLTIGAVAILAAGAAFGWTASHMNEQRRLDMAARDTLGALEPGGASLTPTQPYIGYDVSPGRPSNESTAPRPRTTTATPRATGTRTLALHGAAVHVSVHQSLSSKTSYVGERWTGVVNDPVYYNGREIVPAGSYARGTVVAARPAERGDRATLQLALTSVSVNGRAYRVSARSVPIVAGSTRTRNVGAVAAGTAAGALIGRAVGGSGKGTLIGALVGGGASTAAVAASHGYQATIPAGGSVTFRS